MPLPLLIPAVVGLMGVYGTGKAAKAASDNSTANDINDRAEGLISACNAQIDHKRETCNQNLEELGQKKYGSLTKTLKRFVEVYGKLQNVNLASDRDIEGLTLADFDDIALQKMEKEVSMLTSSALGAGSGLVGGSMAAFGAYSGTMMLASAGTGTAIGSLSGVAATNATLAWLGGGTLASGGLGMAGGAVVLGTLAAGPALLIFGSVLGAKAETKLNEARANLEKAETFEAESEAVMTKLDGICEVANLASQILSELRTQCRRTCNAMACIIEVKGCDYGGFDKSEQAIVFKAVKLAQLVKALVDTAILDEDGNLLSDASANINSAYRASQQI